MGGYGGNSVSPLTFLLICSGTVIIVVGLIVWGMVTLGTIISG